MAGPKTIEQVSTLGQRTSPKLGPRTLSHCFFAGSFWRESPFYIQKPWNPRFFLIQKKIQKTGTWFSNSEKE
jgi:hypothetical protein